MVKFDNISCVELTENELDLIDGGGEKWREVLGAAAEGAFVGGIGGAVTGNPLGIGAGIVGGAIVGAIKEW